MNEQDDDAVGGVGNGPRVILPDPFGPETEHRRSIALAKALGALGNASFVVAQDTKALAARVGESAELSMATEAEYLHRMRTARSDMNVDSVMTLVSLFCLVVGLVWLLVWMNADSAGAWEGWGIAGLIFSSIVLLPAVGYDLTARQSNMETIQAVLKASMNVVTVSREAITLVGGEHTRRIDNSMCSGAAVCSTTSGHLSIRLLFHDGRSETIDWLPFDQGVEARLTEFASSCRSILDEGTSQWLGRLAA